MRLVDTSAWIEWLVGSAAGATVAADLLTCDRHFDGLRDVRLVPKSSG